MTATSLLDEELLPTVPVDPGFVSVRKHFLILEQKSLLHIQRTINLPTGLPSTIKDHKKQALTFSFLMTTLRIFLMESYHILLRFSFKSYMPMLFWPFSLVSHLLIH